MNVREIQMVGKSLSEIDHDLPNGFHDALLETITVSFRSNSVELDMQLFMGDPDANTDQEREAYKAAKLVLSDLVYFVIDPPAPDYEFTNVNGLRIDGGDEIHPSNPKFRKPANVLPVDAFSYWFFVDAWNSFIHVAARGATLHWI